MKRVPHIIGRILSTVFILAAIVLYCLFASRIPGGLRRIGADSTKTETVTGTVTALDHRIQFPSMARHVQIVLSDNETLDFSDNLLWYQLNKLGSKNIQFDMKYWYKDGLPVSYAVSEIRGLD